MIDGTNSGNGTNGKRDTKNELRDAAIRLGVRDGVQGASIRTIAREAGVTEGALYKHFENKNDLIREAYTAIVEEMARDKEVLLRAGLPFEYAVKSWVRLTFEYFDKNPEAFVYVLLMPAQMAGAIGEVYTKQGTMFREFLHGAMERGEAKRMEIGLGFALFSGCVLNIPRLIHEGALDGPAVGYADGVTEVLMDIFGV